MWQVLRQSVGLSNRSMSLHSRALKVPSIVPESALKVPSTGRTSSLFVAVYLMRHASALLASEATLVLPLYTYLDAQCWTLTTIAS